MISQSGNAVEHRAIRGLSVSRIASVEYCGRTEGDRLTSRDDIAEDHSRLMFGCGRGNRAPLSPTGKAITVTASRGMSRSSRSSRGESSVIGNVLNYLFYFVATTAMLLIAGFVYVRFTPSNEVALIREGNVAAGVALSGAMLGYACIVYSAITHGSTLLE